MPCRGTRGFTAPRAPACCCAAGRRSLFWRVGRGAYPCARRCRTFCLTGWRPGPTTSPIRRLGEGLSRLPGTEVYLAPRDSGAQSGVLSFRVQDRDCEELGELLGRRGIALRAGLHCAPLAHRTAGTLESGTLRASVSAFTLPEEIGRALAITEELLREEAV